MKRHPKRAAVIANIRQHSPAKDEVREATILRVIPLDVGQTKVLPTDETLTDLYVSETLTDLNVSVSYLAPWRGGRGSIC